MRRHHHYEAAFEDFIRSCGWPYIPVNEGRKAIFAGSRIKSFDFLVYRPGETAWLVDLKGRKFPYESGGSKRYWENWVTRADLDGLEKWQNVFGEGFESILMFAYWLTGAEDRLPTSFIHTYRANHYGFLWIPAAQYAAHARQRSAKWDTVAVPAKVFRELLRPAKSL